MIPRKPSARYNQRYHDPNDKPLTKRFCGRCLAYTQWRFEYVTRHSECTECRGRLSFKNAEAYERWAKEVRS